MTAPLDIEALRALLAAVPLPLAYCGAQGGLVLHDGDWPLCKANEAEARIIIALMNAAPALLSAAEELARIRAASPDVEEIRERVALVSPWIGNPEVIDATMVGAVAGQALAESVADFHAHAPVDVRTLLAALDAKAAEAEREKGLRERAQDALRREGIGAVMAERDEARRELAAIVALADLPPGAPAPEHDGAAYGVALGFKNVADQHRAARESLDDAHQKLIARHREVLAAHRDWSDEARARIAELEGGT